MAKQIKPPKSDNPVRQEPEATIAPDQVSPASSGASAPNSSEPQHQPQAKSAAELNLTNHFLIAMPSMLDPIFGGTVIYLCEHNQRGAMGLVINRPTDLTVAGLFDRIDLKLEIIPNSHPMREKPVMFGGPVQDDRGFVLHAPVGKFSSSLKVTDEIAFTTSRDVLEAVASGDGPEQVMVSIGYAGWSAGQLEQEILANGWLTVAADAKILFDLPIEERFLAAIKLLGIDPLMLASEAGHA
ncbi:YqgE/AlgH family protein [Undibacterium sp. RTI2.1]|uniref:YqgE/AlgH family protein n=1 Tax=unclassified Undibacterium TaxID=2630295 RepID=UPI002AB4A093|nr:MULTISPECIES: YqgE/AlgH family protein [unclassified Undibacterium]MDY7540492.1 YqgE/AlgH family protein [Undibacterium sp. 5I1]MEB0030626.1 YqgE/AlgH family protein [Undibacterium sp. RTI2.1]MEB0116566.1 YqgE/AlgH family protein [Undibacterium sp. RTI2.2]MEB0230047.1 YqgE/AlgH family protein [Undibacterium sp. 10I3]MEB0257751.1 YqgE/AlgH family protein [Undibacterium sp. 5I1]